MFYPCGPFRKMKGGILGTSLILFFSNPSLACPKNPLYGAKVKGFGASRIYPFSDVNGDGKLWQLRSVQVGKNWFILPFVINTGGSSWKEPIISQQAMKKIGLHDIKKDMLSPFENHAHILRMPTPLGVIPTPLSYDWDHAGKNEIPDEDVRFNLVGQQLAHIIGTIDDDLESFNASAEMRRLLIENLAKKYRNLRVEEKFIEMEVDAMNSSQNSGKSWTSESLPFDDSFIK